MKSYLGSKPLREQSIETLNALFFINFIALILKHRLLKIMFEKELLKKYSLEKLMLEILKIRKIILVNGKEVVSEITKKKVVNREIKT